MVADTRVLEALEAGRQLSPYDQAVLATAQKAIERREDLARGLGFLAGVAATLIVGIGVVLLMRLAGG
tara:strand:- start:119 stop:322 length:204 start_codon:yes stop_codon:yes gene_type:complete